MYRDIENMQVVDLLCKHVLNLSAKACAVLKESDKLDYQWCKWGSHLDSYSLEYHLSRIKDMEAANYEHSIRVVVCKYSFVNEPYIWTDNLHSTIMQVRKHGLDVKLKNIPHYIVSTDGVVSEIYCTDNSFIDSDNNKNGAIFCATKRFNRSNSKALLDIGYTVRDFINDNKELLK